MRTTYGSAGGAQREETGQRVVGGVLEVVPVYHPEEARAARLVVQLGPAPPGARSTNCWPRCPCRCSSRRCRFTLMCRVIV